MNTEKIRVKCTGIDDEGKGIISIKGQEIHVADLLDGEKALIDVQRNRNYISARVAEIEEKSKDRVKPECPHFEKCGGCHLQHMSYSKQLEFKQNKVEKLLKEFGKVNPILGMKEPYFYRNKIHSAVSMDKNRKLVSGIYEEYSHNVISVDKCIIQDSIGDKITASILEIMKQLKLRPYNEDSGNGFMRHVLIKRGFATGEVMVVLIVASQMFPGRSEFVSVLRKKHPEITTIIMNVNNRKTSAVLGRDERVLFGKGYIEDKLCGCTFRISPKSFYQINPTQTEVLYGKAIEMAGLTGKETVLDAYSGIGTISIIAGKKAKEVLGVELNRDAVRDAITNAKLNKADSVKFINADAGDFMADMAKSRQKADVVFMDPPRSGSDEKFLSSLVKFAPKRVVYISCNPVTQQRDLKYLTKHGYKVKEIQPVDMFPQTWHVEAIVLLHRKNN